VFITLLFIGLIAFFWWLESGIYLIYLILFLGCMSGMYVAIDMLQELVLHQSYQSDATKFADVCPICPSKGWGCVWMTMSVVFMVCAVIVAIIVF